MRNDEQQPPPGLQSQQPYQGWQHNSYNQDQQPAAHPVGPPSNNPSANSSGPYNEDSTIIRPVGPLPGNQINPYGLVQPPRPPGPLSGNLPNNPNNPHNPEQMGQIQPPGRPPGLLSGHLLNNPNNPYNPEQMGQVQPPVRSPGPLSGNLLNNPNNPYNPEKVGQTQPPVRSPGPLSSNLPNNPNNPYNPEQMGQMYGAGMPYTNELYDPDLTMDMGSSLGYSQSIQFHAISMPQPTQSMPRVHQTRLQQLREDRMRRQQRRMNPDATLLIRRKKPGPQTENKSPFIQQAQPLVNNASIEEAPTDIHAATPNLSPAGALLQPAAEPSQDTGMIQRVKVARAGSLISAALMLSSILGLLQTFLFTYVFGVSNLGDAYLQAYIIPNLIYTVVAGGALSSAFIPVFTSYAVGRNDEKAAWHIASSALNIAVAAMTVFSLIGVFLAPVIVPLYNVNAKPAELALIITLTRIMLIQAVVLGSGVIVGAVLNTKQDFTRTALGTVLYNVGLDLGLIPGFLMAFHERLTAPSEVAVYAATWGVVLAAILQVGVQIPGLFKVKMRYTFTFDWRHPGVRQIYKQMIPRAVNALMLSFSTAVDRALLTAIAIGASGYINEYFQAFSILLLPVSIFGSSVSTAAFPTLAGYVARGRFDRVRSIITETMRGILFLTIPSAVGLVTLAFPITQTLLEHGEFTLQGAQSAAIPLTFFAIGLPALAAVEILTRSFYALQDSKTPVVISVAQFILKIALSIILLNIVTSPQWGMGALAFSTAIASILEAIALFILLSQRISGFDKRSLLTFFGHMLLACVAMVVVLIPLRLGLGHLIDTTSTTQLFIPGILAALVKLIIELGAGSLAFLVVARLLHMEEMNTGLVRRVLNLLRIPWL